MPRYRLTIAYDGTEFCGWQKQEPPAGGDVAPEKVMGAVGDALPGNGESERETAVEGPGADASGSPRESRIVLRTVQEVVERAVREVVREPVMLKGASRTDAGVHARGQVAAFSCGEGWPVERGTDKLVLALNSRLPRDVVVVAAEVVDAGFDPISDCTGKGYSYTLHVSPVRPLWDRRYVQHVWTPLDVAAMNEAAARIVGEHDFAAFAAAGHGRLSTVRRVFECRVVEEATGKPADPRAGTSEVRGADAARRVRIEVSGNGFLWNMVRIIAGTLMEVGRGRMTREQVSAAIESKNRRQAGPTLPPAGLCLEWVRYGGTSKDGRP